MVGTRRRRSQKESEPDGRNQAETERRSRSRKVGTRTFRVGSRRRVASCTLSAAVENYRSSGDETRRGKGRDAEHEPQECSEVN